MYRIAEQTAVLSCILYLSNYKITAILTLRKSRVGEACSYRTYRTLPNQQVVALAKPVPTERIAEYLLAVC